MSADSLNTKIDQGLTDIDHLACAVSLTMRFGPIALFKSVCLCVCHVMKICNHFIDTKVTRLIIQPVVRSFASLT